MGHIHMRITEVTTLMTRPTMVMRFGATHRGTRVTTKFHLEEEERYTSFFHTGFICIYGICKRIFLYSFLHIPGTGEIIALDLPARETEMLRATLRRRHSSIKIASLAWRPLVAQCVHVVPCVCPHVSR